jgi:hypothetical protein
VYKYFVLDSKRKFLRNEELLHFSWWFNFSSSAGGNGTHSAQKVTFNCTPDVPDYFGQLHMRGYPAMPWKLEPPGTPAPDGIPVHICKNCMMPATKRCGMCKDQWYCSVECQKLAWKSHKSVCAKGAKAKADAATNGEGASAGGSSAPGGSSGSIANGVVGWDPSPDPCSQSQMSLAPWDKGKQVLNIVHFPPHTVER